jgi:hypothetical protein
MTNDIEATRLHLAEAVRDACVRAALEAFADAAADGLCCEGAFEAAVEAIRAIDVRTLIADGRRRTVSG